MADNSDALKKMQERKHEADVDRIAEKMGREMGPVRVLGEESPIVEAFNEAMKKKRLRGVN